MMQWMLLVTVACVAGLSLEQSACFEDSQCTVGSYCLPDVQHCRECLQCGDLRRQRPKNNVKCVKSVVECGPCEEGLVVDREGVGAGCTEPETEGAIPAYVWAVVVVCLLLFALVLAALVYMLRHTDTFKVLASTRTSVQAPVVSNGSPPPSAPQPPPYNYSHYEPVRPASPPQTEPCEDTAAAMPFVKRAGSTRGAVAGGGAAARESAGSQNARVFGNPAYVRNVPPPSYDSAFSDESDHEPFVPHDEDTMESVWTPEPRYNDHNGNEMALATISTEQETASGPAPAIRRDSLSDSNPPPAKIRCVEDSNNNRNQDGGESSSTLPPPPPAAPPAPPPAAPAAPSVVINVLNVNSVR